MSTNTSLSPSATQPILYLRMLRIAASKVPRYTLKVFHLGKLQTAKVTFWKGFGMDRCQGGLPMWLSGKESTWKCGRRKRNWFNPWVRKIPWRRKWQPTLVFLPGKFHGQRSLAGYIQSIGSQRVRHDWATSTFFSLSLLFSFLWIKDLSKA